MAFQATVSTNWGETINNCYVVVECEKSKIRLQAVKIIAMAFISQEMRNLNKPIPGTTVIKIVEMGNNDIVSEDFAPFEEDALKNNGRTDTEQAYIYLKENHPACCIDFENAIDC